MSISPPLEQTALLSRPELKEQDYQVRIHAAETRKSLLRMLPGLEVSAGGHYDSNSFMVNQSWADVGVKVTGTCLICCPVLRLTKRRRPMRASRRFNAEAMSLAIMAQLYVARANFK